MSAIAEQVGQRNDVLAARTLTLLDPAYFGPFTTQRGGRRSAPEFFSFFPELLEGVTCSKMGLQLSSRKNLQFKTHFWCFSHLVPRKIAVKKKIFFLIFWRSEATLAPFITV